MKKKEIVFGKLDNTAHLFPVIANETMTNVYRISVTLTESVEPELLQKALEQVLPLFETMHVRMRTGMFWYYFETNTKEAPLVQEEDEFPCRYIDPHSNNGYLFRVTYYKERINLEVFHVLADGMGASNFLRELIYHYLRLRHPGDFTGVPDQLSDDTSLDTEDSYLKYYNKYEKTGYQAEPAIHMKGHKLGKGELSVIHGTFSLQEVKKKAKEFSMSINEYLAGNYVYSIYKGYLKEHPSKKPIVLCVPVNLRPFFSSMTTRNFFAMVSIPFYPEKKEMDRITVLKLVKEQLKEKVTKEHLEKLISYNVSNQKNLALRSVPLFLKNPAIKLVYLNSVMGTTTTLTNMGSFTVKEEYRPYIQKFHVILCPSQGQNLKGTISSCGDELTVTFSSLLQDTSVQQTFFEGLLEDGLAATVDSNGVGEKIEIDEKESDVKATYPDIEQKIRMFQVIEKKLVKILAVIEAMLLLINFLTFSSVPVYWSVIAGGGMTYAVLTLRDLLRIGQGHILKIYRQVCTVLALLVLIDFSLGWKGWSLEFGLPCIIYCLVTAIVICMCVNFSHWHNYVFMQMVACILSLIDVLLHVIGVLHHITLAWIALGLSVSLWGATMLVGNRKAKNELKRKLHI